MNKMFALVLAAGLGCGGTAVAAPDAMCDAKLQAQLNALQNQVSALQTGVVIEQAAPSGSDIPSGG